MVIFRAKKDYFHCAKIVIESSEEGRK